jgi:hypothetical protein
MGDEHLNKNRMIKNGLEFFLMKINLWKDSACASLCMSD